MTYRVNGGWIYDGVRYKIGDTVDLTREQYEYFSKRLPGLLEPSTVELKTTKRRTADGDVDASDNTNESAA